MEKSNALTILKHALLMERKGKSLYLTAMEHSEDEKIKEFFKELADDEQEHMEILGRQFKALMSSGKFMAGAWEGDGSRVDAPDILSDDLKARVNAAGFESAAVTAAVAFEQKAVQVYADRAKETDDPEESKLYSWLSEWEKTHLKKLTDLESALIEDIWNDNNFWPF